MSIFRRLVVFAAAPRSKSLGRGVLLASGACLVLLALHEAWVAEDGFITFRTIDNFVNGYGLRWNLDQRVQTFTHPLWLFINSVPYYFVREIAPVVTAVGLVCTASAYLTIGSRFDREPAVLLIGLFFPLAISQTWVVYSTSAFENSLSHLCYAGFAWHALRIDGRNAVPWGALGLTAALGALNRLDTALVYTPPLLYLMLSHWKEIRWSKFLLGFAPLAAWLVFSTFYYGFPYPNTAEAKINGELPRGMLIRQGGFYAFHLLFRDPAGFLMLFAGATITFGQLWKALARPLTRATPRRSERSGQRSSGSAMRASLGLGALLYCCYVVWLGGTYLSGRHWSLPIFISVILGAEQLQLLARGVQRRASEGDDGSAVLEGAARPLMWITAVTVSIAVVGALAFRGYVTSNAQVWAQWKGEQRGVIDSTVSSALFLDDDYHWKKRSKMARWMAEGQRLRGKKVVISTTVGMKAIAAGRDVVFIDRYALTDPLLARLPTRPNFSKMDHFKRDVPRGYFRSRASHQHDLLNPHLRAYYLPLLNIVSGPLLSSERLANIVAFNLGRYDHHRDDYLEQIRKLKNNARRDGS